MKILLFGSSGLLGNYLKRTLMKENDIISPAKYELDIQATEKIEKKIDSENIEAIINASGMTNVYLCEKNEEKTYKINAIAPGDVAKIAYNHNIPFVHFSTNFIFDGKKNDLYLESDKPNPLNVYAKSKVDGENRVRQNNTNSLIIRSAEIFGIGKYSPNHNIPYYIIRQIINKKDLNLYQINTSPTYAYHIALRVMELIKNKVNGILHLVNNGQCTYFEIAEKILKIMKRRAEIKIKESIFSFDVATNIPLGSERLSKTGIEEMPDAQTALSEFIKEVL